MKRGLRQKLRNGEWPGLAPIGYLNDLKTHTIIKDPEKFRHIKKLFELYATSNYYLKDLEDLTISWDLISQRKRKGLSVSIIQRILQNKLYIGLFTYKGETYQGKHKPMVSKKLFDKVQIVMKSKAHHTTKSVKFYTFRGLLKCGECGCVITSQTQKGHIYYNCTKKRVPCSQRYVREEKLEEQISKILQKVSLPSAWTKKMIAELEKENIDKERVDFSFVQSLKSQIEKYKDKLDKLLELQLSGVISTEEYTEKKQKILNQKIEISEKLKTFQQKGFSWLEPAKRFILEANEAKNVALKGNLVEKRDFLKKVGSNLVLINQQIKYFPRGAWKILGNLGNLPARHSLRHQALASGSAEPRSGEAQNKEDFSKCIVWRGRRDSNSQPHP